MPDEPGFLQRLLGVKATPAASPAPTPDAHVLPDAARCVQCGVCGYNCPVGIPVRDFARQGRMVDDPRCLQCGQCIAVCPRGTLRWSTPAEKWAPGQEPSGLADLALLFPDPDEPAL
ncbi:MAG: 4Fe-4S dicluster domain-containing protein [Anaerolineales bacterium]